MYKGVFVLQIWGLIFSVWRGLYNHGGGNFRGFTVGLNPGDFAEKHVLKLQ